VEILMTYLYQYPAIACCCADAGLRLANSRAIIGECDLWVRLPDHPF
jgi:hypothetical protein